MKELLIRNHLLDFIFEERPPNVPPTVTVLEEKKYLLLGTTLLGTDTVNGPQPLMFPAAARKKYRLPRVRPAARTRVPPLDTRLATSCDPQTLEKSARDDHSTKKENINSSFYLFFL